MAMLDWLPWRRKRTPAESSLRDSQKETLKRFEQLFRASGIRHALIGGVAMAIHGAVRGTKDIDYLVDPAGEETVHKLFESLGFEPLQDTADVSSYLLDNLRIDILYAQRPYSKAMLAGAVGATIDDIEVLAVKPEDIIGLKLQALMHQPGRVQDRADIVTLLRLHGVAMDQQRMREYARVLSMEGVLDELERQV